MGFSQDKELIKPSKKSYEIDFTIHSPSDIQKHQDNQIEEVSQILGQPPRLLLSSFVIFDGTRSAL